eukprot:3251412-Pleurochrysis_carterae.AAC.2
MHVEEDRSVRRGFQGYPFPIRGRGGFCGTTPSQAASADAFAAYGDLGVAIRYASASPSTSGVHRYRWCRPSLRISPAVIA